MKEQPSERGGEHRARPECSCEEKEREYAVVVEDPSKQAFE